jgi:hypothetical protein
MNQTLKIVKNELEMRKLWPLKVKGVKNSKKTTPTIEHYKGQGQFPNIQKKICMLLCCYESSQTICKTSGGTFDSILNRLK